METKHTPGPWEIEWGQAITIGDDVAKLDIRRDGKHTANAYLIAAAPELLAACEAMSAHYSASLDHQPHYVRLARAAIAKATWRTG